VMFSRNLRNIDTHLFSLLVEFSDDTVALQTNHLNGVCLLLLIHA